jgi:hypothetical protein
VEVDLSWLNSPATRTGSYDLIAIVNETANGVGTARSAAAGEFQLQSSQLQSNGAFLQTLSAPPGFLPDGLSNLILPSGDISWTLNPGGPNFQGEGGDYDQWLGQNLKEYDVYSDGSKKLHEDYDFTRTGFQGIMVDLPSGGHAREGYEEDIGYSYVAMGEWEWQPVALNSDGSVTATGSRNSIVFAYGDRTPAAAIPPSGTATYDAHTLEMRSSSGEIGIPFTLTADFGLRTIATRIDQDFQNWGDDDPIQGIHVAGTAPFSNDGSFDIPLTGTVNYSYENEPAPPPSQTATGDMNGAFFGPNAEQVGGTLSLQRSGDQMPLFQDAFVGQQHQP